MISKHLPLVVGAIIVLALGAFLFFHAKKPTNPQEVIKAYQKEWNYSHPDLPKALACGDFSSPTEAQEKLNLYVPLSPCKENNKRLIGFIEEENLYGFLTCFPMGDTYFCCAEVSAIPTSSYLDWKQRCT